MLTNDAIVAGRGSWNSKYPATALAGKPAGSMVPYASNP